MHMGSVSLGTVSIFCVSTCGQRCEYSFACIEVWERMLVYMCACSSSSMCQVRPQTPPHSTPTPPNMPLPVEDCRRCVGGFSRGAGCSSERRPTLGGSLGGAWPCWAPIGGWGAFGSPGPGPGLPWYGRLPVEPAGLPPRHPGASTLWLSEVPPSAYPLPFFRVEAAVVPAVGSPGGPVYWGPPELFGARVFSMPASYIAGGGCCSPHTLLNI